MKLAPAKTCSGAQIYISVFRKTGKLATRPIIETIAPLQLHTGTVYKRPATNL
jgi:hypothetical protein